MDSRASRAPYLFPAGARLGADNAVLQAKANRHTVENYAGPLSIKTVISGEVAWIIGGRELVVNRSSLLVVNAGDRYSMNIDALRPVETCCVFFAPGFVEGIAMDSTSPLERALEEPEPAAWPIPYLTALHEDSENALAKRVKSLAPRCRGGLAPSGFEEDFLLVAGDLLRLYAQIREQAGRLPAVRASTREELYRRLLIGREYLHASAGPVSLASTARAACLSPFHFHRGFAKAFGRTPHAYLTALRLERARIALESGAHVLEACLAAGFESPSAFTRLFRANYASPPSAFRCKFARTGRNSEAAPSILDP